jgi:hypothetical protein
LTIQSGNTGDQSLSALAEWRVMMQLQQLLVQKSHDAKGLVTAGVAATTADIVKYR